MLYRMGWGLRCARRACAAALQLPAAAPLALPAATALRSGAAHCAAAGALEWRLCRCQRHARYTACIPRLPACGAQAFISVFVKIFRVLLRAVHDCRRIACATSSRIGVCGDGDGWRRQTVKNGILWRQHLASGAGSSVYRVNAVSTALRRTLQANI